jgi:hypothetical protein
VRGRTLSRGSRSSADFVLRNHFKKVGSTQKMTTVSRCWRLSPKG